MIGIFLGLLGIILAIESQVASRRHNAIIVLLKEIKAELAQIRPQAESHQPCWNEPPTQS
jgi:hypothetical protein